MLPEMTAVNGAFSAVKNALDALKSAKDLSGSSALKAQITELHEKIVDARVVALAALDDRASLLKQIDDLKAEIVQLKAWNREKEQYEPKNVDIGALAYVPKPGTEAASEPHWLCPTCFQNCKPSHLQLQSERPDVSHRHIFGCFTCGTKIKVHWRKSPTNPTGAVL
jgi:hypothetical protein